MYYNHCGSGQSITFQFCIAVVWMIHWFDCVYYDTVAVNVQCLVFVNCINVVFNEHRFRLLYKTHYCYHRTMFVNCSLNDCYCQWTMFKFSTLFVVQLFVNGQAVFELCCIIFYNEQYINVIYCKNVLVNEHYIDIMLIVLPLSMKNVWTPIMLSPFINDQYFISDHVFIRYIWTMINLFLLYHFLSITNVWTIFIASLVWWILFKLYWLYHIFLNDQCLDYFHCVTVSLILLPINKYLNNVRTLLIVLFTYSYSRTSLLYN